MRLDLTKHLSTFVAICALTISIGWSCAIPVCSQAATADINYYYADQVFLVPLPVTVDKHDYDYTLSWTSPTDREGFAEIRWWVGGNPSNLIWSQYYLTFPGPGRILGVNFSSPRTEAAGNYYKLYIDVIDSITGQIYASDAALDGDLY